MHRRLAQVPVAWWATLLISLPCAVFSLSHWHSIPLDHATPVGQNDPDTWLRLTLVRDWLLSGNWYDHTVWRSNAPFAAGSSPWTRPLDMVIASLVALQPDSVDLSLRLMRAALILPVLWMTLLVVGIQRAIRAMLPLPSAIMMASVFVITLPMLWNYFSLGNADHHAPLAVLFIWAMGGVLTESPSRRLMLFTGVLLGLQLWISVEALMLIAIIYCWYGVGWLRGHAGKALSLAWLSTATAITALIALLVERPSTAWLTPVYDSISIAQVYALMVSAMFAWALHILPTRTLRGRFTLAILGSALVLFVMALTYPKLLHGPMVEVDPYIFTDFLPQISEAKPFYAISPFMLTAMLLVPLVGLGLCMLSLWRKRLACYDAAYAETLAFFLAATLLLYLAQQRWSYYLLPLAIVSVAPLLGAMFTPEHPSVRGRWPACLLVGLPPKIQAKRRLPFVLAVLGLPFIFLVAGTDPDVSNDPARQGDTPKNVERLQTAQRDGCYKAARTLIRSGELARVLPSTPMTLLVPTDLGTEILFFTPHRIVASNYHRDGHAIAYVWGADKLTEEAALRAHLAARHIEAVLLCPKVGAKTQSLLQSYLAGAALPNWLRPITYTLPVPATAPEDMPETPSFPVVKPLLLRILEPRDADMPHA
jgi:hypothetical protein